MRLCRLSTYWRITPYVLIVTVGYGCRLAEAPQAAGDRMASGLEEEREVVAAPSAAGDRLALVRFAPGPAPLAVYSGLDQAANFIVSSRAEWAGVWGAVWGRQEPVPELPDVDFRVNVVIVAAMGVQSGGGYAVYVDSAYQRDSHVEVFLRKVSSGASCMTNPATTAPVDAAWFPRPEHEVRFTEVAMTVECDERGRE
jgi:hypothetical protein